jgi:hypothetical protein
MQQENPKTNPNLESRWSRIVIFCCCSVEIFVVFRSTCLIQTTIDGWGFSFLVVDSRRVKSTHDKKSSTRNKQHIFDLSWKGHRSSCLWDSDSLFNNMRALGRPDWCRQSTPPPTTHRRRLSAKRKHRFRQTHGSHLLFTNKH